jgi:quercetin dioxygenase-like cupin family protein
MATPLLPGRTIFAKELRMRLSSTLAALTIALSVSSPAWAIEQQVLLETDHTIMDEPIVYPSGKANVTAVIATLAPGESTNLHTHGVPTFGYILDGELTVDYGERGKRVYHTGESVMEAISVAHKGTNAGSIPVRILVVFMGVEGRPNSVPVASGGK